MTRIDKPLPPFNKHLGFEIEAWQEGHVVIRADVGPEHCNHSGIAHGGFIATLLDAATALPGTYCDSENTVRRALTLSLSISFYEAGANVTVESCRPADGIRSQNILWGG